MNIGKSDTDGKGGEYNTVLLRNITIKLTTAKWTMTIKRKVRNYCIFSGEKCIFAGYFSGEKCKNTYLISGEKCIEKALKI